MKPSRLAIDGGPRVWDRPLAPWPLYDEEIVEAVSEVLRSGRVNYWTGDQGRAFEEEYAESLGSKHAIALSNGTVALELALRAIDLQPGDEVIVPARTFIATASSVVMCGGRPVVADIDPQTGNLTAETVREVMSPRTRAVIPVHVAGCPCEMDEIMELAEECRWWVIEDCAQAHGASYRGRPVGTIGHLGAFSFCQDKILSTGGEGGLLVTSEEALYRRAWEFKDHGKSLEKVHETGHPPLFRYLHDSFGTNMRMTEMQAAIGRIILARLPEWVAHRQKNAALLDRRFSEVPGLNVLRFPRHLSHAYYKYYVRLSPGMLAAGWDQDELILAIRAEGIPCGSGSCAEIYREKAFQDSQKKPFGRLRNARQVGESHLMFTVHPTLSLSELHATADAVGKVMHWATTSRRHPLSRAG